MIHVSISALVKCLLDSAGWGVAFVVELWMQMAHAQRALRGRFVRRMATVLRTCRQMTSVRRPLLQAIDLRPTIVQKGVAHPIEQTGLMSKT